MTLKLPETERKRQDRSVCGSVCRAEKPAAGHSQHRISTSPRPRGALRPGQRLAAGQKILTRTQDQALLTSNRTQLEECRIISSGSEKAGQVIERRKFFLLCRFWPLILLSLASRPNHSSYFLAAQPKTPNKIKMLMAAE